MSRCLLLIHQTGRLVLMPINLLRMAKTVCNKKAIVVLKPELAEIKNKYKDQPSPIAKSTMALL